MFRSSSSSTRVRPRVRSVRAAYWSAEAARWRAAGCSRTADYCAQRARAARALSRSAQRRGSVLAWYAVAVVADVALLSLLAGWLLLR